MLELSDWKVWAAILSQVIGVCAFIPYIREILRRNTKPHAYTWLIWALTFGTATLAIWTGGGGLVLAIGMTINVALSFTVFLLSLKYGTNNITRGDTIALVGALVAILVWWFLDDPLLALFLATAIDAVGYWPTYRKSFIEPWTEDLLTWVMYTAAPVLTLLSLMQYNLLTTTYSVMCVFANGGLLLLLYLRRRSLSHSS